MASINDIVGINTIVAPPFDANGNLDFEDLEKLIDHLIEKKVHGTTLFGIASEFYKLTDDERNDMAKLLCSKCKESKTYCVLSVTDHSKDVAVRRAKYYEQIGADALMILPPFFLNPSIEQIKDHIFAVLEAVSIPVLIQYAPGETKKEIDVDEMALIKNKYPNALFKLEPNPPMDYVRAMLKRSPDAKILIGYAGLYMIDVLDAGGVGTMPGCSFVEIYQKIYALYREGNRDAAVDLHRRLMKYVKVWMSNVEYIIAVEKLILQKRGIIKTDYCRAPYYTLSEQDRKDVDTFLEEFSEFFK